jgi:tetrahydromethanopterin S-methyltransferase subunit C
MYIHSSLYERAPQYWIFVGILLVVLGIYLGVEMSSTFLYVGVTLGLASCVWGVRILMRRARRLDDADVAASSVSID